MEGPLYQDTEKEITNDIVRYLDSLLATTNALALFSLQAGQDFVMVIWSLAHRSWGIREFGFEHHGYVGTKLHTSREQALFWDSGVLL
jgi:hypothetical protein